MSILNHLRYKKKTHFKKIASRKIHHLLYLVFTHLHISIKENSIKQKGSQNDMIFTDCDSVNEILVLNVNDNVKKQR